MSRMAITTKRTWLPQWTSRIRQLGEGGKDMAVGAGAEAVGAAGAVDAGVREAAWAKVAVAGAGAGTGVGVRAEEAAGDGAGVEEALDTEGTLSCVCTDGPLEGYQDNTGWMEIIAFMRQQKADILLHYPNCFGLETCFIFWLW